MTRLLLFLSQRLLIWATDSALRNALPKVFSRLDFEVPQLLTHKAPPARIEGTIASAIGDALGSRATVEQINTVIALYDPVRAALRNLKG